MKSKAFAAFAVVVFVSAAIVFAAGHNTPTQGQMEVFAVLVEEGLITEENFQIFLNEVQTVYRLQREVRKAFSEVRIISVKKTDERIIGGLENNTIGMQFEVEFFYANRKHNLSKQRRGVLVRSADEIEMTSDVIKILARKIIEEIREITK